MREIEGKLQQSTCRCRAASYSNRTQLTRAAEVQV